MPVLYMLTASVLLVSDLEILLNWNMAIETRQAQMTVTSPQEGLVLSQLVWNSNMSWKGEAPVNCTAVL